jgi:hypothetical protein
LSSQNPSRKPQPQWITDIAAIGASTKLEQCNDERALVYFDVLGVLVGSSSTFEGTQDRNNSHAVLTVTIATTPQVRLSASCELHGHTDPTIATRPYDESTYWFTARHHVTDRRDQQLGRHHSTISIHSSRHNAPPLISL